MGVVGIASLVLLDGKVDDDDNVDSDLCGVKLGNMLDSF